MRPKHLLFYSLLLCIWSLFLLVVFSSILGKRTVNIYAKCEHKFYHSFLEANYSIANKTSILRRTPSLNWIKELKGTAVLNTVPSVSSPKCRRAVFLVILVASSPDHFAQRNAIRSSWATIIHSNSNTTLNIGSFKPKDYIRTVFLLGKSDKKDVQMMVDYETKLYGDIVIGNFKDNYQNLVYKTRLGLTWAYAQCSSSYILKTDDDVFVNAKKLVEWLWLSTESTNVYTGWCNYRSKVSRNKRSKWYVSIEDYSQDEFPPYCLGGGYLISTDVLSHIIKPLYTDQVFPLEDIFVGVQINKLNIQPIDNRKHFNLLYAGIKDVCDYIDALLLHPVQIADLAEIHLAAELARKVCK